MQKIIENVIVVDGDGHCVFCAFVCLRDMFVDDHQMILYQLHKELISEENVRYRRMIG